MNSLLPQNVVPRLSVRPFVEVTEFFRIFNLTSHGMFSSEQIHVFVIVQNVNEIEKNLFFPVISRDISTSIF